MFDSHVHASPDVVPRAVADLELGQQYLAAGASGFVLKAHHESTVGRAASVAAHTGLDVVGGVVLNHANGGLNPDAVLASLHSGGRLVWFPTQDSHTQLAAKLPRLADLDPRLRPQVLALPPVAEPSGDDADDVHLILDLIAEYDAVLCTGHVSVEECRWLFEQAERRGIRRFLLTHPSYTVPAMSLADIRQFAAAGAHVEVTAFQMLHQPEMTPDHLAQVARAAGDRLVLSSDAGQPDSPDPPQALQDLFDLLAARGVDRGLLRAAAGHTPRELVLQ